MNAIKFASDSPQFCSSDISPQSLSPSQTPLAKIHRPLSHWNRPGEHVRDSEHQHTTFTVNKKLTLTFNIFGYSGANIIEIGQDLN